MNVADVMCQLPVVIDAFENLEVAAQVMRARVIGALPVVEHEKLVGIITDRDLVLRAVAAGDKPWETYVREVMTPHPATCRPDETVGNAAERMIGRCVRRLVVVEGDRVVGMLSVDDLALSPATRALAIQVLQRLALVRGIELDGTFQAVEAP
jgi:CBS domain-containing protein